jgi:hypothetical protein
MNDDRNSASRSEWNAVFDEGNTKEQRDGQTL